MSYGRWVPHGSPAWCWRLHGADGGDVGGVVHREVGYFPATRGLVMPQPCLDLLSAMVEVERASRVKVATAPGRPAPNHSRSAPG